MSDPKGKNTVIVVEGSYQDFDDIFTLFQSGKLEKMLGIPVSDVRAVSKYKPTPTIPLPVHLSNWFQRNIIENWKNEATLLGTFLAQQMNEASSSTTPFGVTRSANELTDSQKREKKEINFQTAVELGESNDASPEVIDALVNALQSSDEETNWQIALTLGKLDRNHPQAAIAHHKTIKIAEHEVELFVALRKTEEDLVDILLQVYKSNFSDLPPDLELVVLDETGQKMTQDEIRETFLETKAHDKDYCINLYIYSRPFGERFTVKISLGDASITEDFLI